MKKPLKHNGEKSGYTITKRGNVKRIIGGTVFGIAGHISRDIGTFSPNSTYAFDSLDLRAIADYLDKINK